MPTKAKLGAKAMGRRALDNNEGYELGIPTCWVVLFCRSSKSKAGSWKRSLKPKVLTTMFLPLKSVP